MVTGEPLNALTSKYQSFFLMAAGSVCQTGPVAQYSSSLMLHVVGQYNQFNQTAGHN
jgi:hypothetical protein